MKQRRRRISIVNKIRRATETCHHKFSVVLVFLQSVNSCCLDNKAIHEKIKAGREKLRDSQRYR